MRPYPDGRCDAMAAPSWAPQSVVSGRIPYPRLGLEELQRMKLTERHRDLA